jgi:hypothetical protein
VLEELALSMNCYLPVEVVTSFFERSSCPLRSFSFEGYITTSLLQLLPSLKTLTINDLYTTEAYPPGDYWPRSSSRRAQISNKDFYQTSRFWNILANCIYVQDIIPTYIPSNYLLITLYMVLFVYLNSTFIQQFAYQKTSSPTS